MSYLADTNIFLEILLEQNKNAACKSFLENNSDKIFISDFSLHSIGVILFRSKRQALFTQFCLDVLPVLTVLAVASATDIQDISRISQQYQLDFDDAYQVKICEIFDLELVTMDLDFKKVSSPLKVLFL